MRLGILVIVDAHKEEVVGIFAAIDLPKRRQRVTQLKRCSVKSVLLTTAISPDLSMYSPFLTD